MAKEKEVKNPSVKQLPKLIAFFNFLDKKFKDTVKSSKK
jgi:hypothetical protein